ncbi:MAG: hypothetical protein EBX52_02940 [Proteobacteria bacterium]|nr:hypothetical protein [Pseudomonadota bacterium]
MTKHRILIPILIFATALPTVSSGQSLQGFWNKCVRLASRLNPRSENRRIAEEILLSYKPYDQHPFELVPITERSDVSVFKGIDPLHPDAPFILKVVRLSEALNDYFGLKTIKSAQEISTAKINVVDSVLLTPKREKVSLSDKSVEKAAYVEGRPLVEILADPKEPNARKITLLKEFKEWQSGIEDALQTLGFSTKREKVNPGYFKKHERLFMEIPDFEKTQPDMLFASRAWGAFFEGWFFDTSLYNQVGRLSRGQIQTLLLTGSNLEIILKTDNILVDAKNRMTLIDPY